jgi:cell division protein FtsZ
MSLKNFQVEEVLQETLSGAKIKVIGVGGGGGNMVNHMIRNNIEGIEMIVANTDAQVLSNSLCENRIQLGGKLTKGLGAGMQPDIGRASAEENADDVRAQLEGADIVFIAAGLGGGTGTGASPVIAQIAREVGALTIAVVTKPFMFEGGKRNRLAQIGLEELKKESDSIVVIPNDKLLTLVDRSLGIKESFKIVDEILARAVMGTSGIILSSSPDDINIDFADLKTVMSYRGLALMGVGEAQGEKAAYEALKNAIESPLLDDVSINGAMGVLVHFNLNPNYPLLEIQDAMQIIYESCDDEATIIMGTTANEDFPQDFVNITMIATGFEQKAAETKAPSTQKTPQTIIQRTQINLKDQEKKPIQQLQPAQKQVLANKPENIPEEPVIPQPQQPINPIPQQQMEYQSIQPKKINLDDQISIHKTSQQYKESTPNNIYSLNNNRSMNQNTKSLSNNSDDYDIPTWLRRRDKNF